MDLMVAIKSWKYLKEFLEGDSFIQTLALLDLQAAHSAIKKGKYSKDKKSHLYSAINHLESREAKLFRSLSDKSMRKYKTEKWLSIESQIRHTRCFTALIYLYLRDIRVAKELVDTIIPDLEPYNTLTINERNFIKNWNKLYNPMAIAISIHQSINKVPDSIMWSNEDIYTFKVSLYKRGKINAKPGAPPPLYNTVGKFYYDLLDEIFPDSKSNSDNDSGNSNDSPFDWIY